MTRRMLLVVATGAPVLLAQQSPAQLPVQLKAEPAPPPPVFVCPMDPDVKSGTPGRCPRCGMELVARILEPQTCGIEMTFHPPVIPSGSPVDIAFRILDPKTKAPLTEFELVHEKLCHFFAVSQDLEWFLHDHPVLGEGGVFRLPVTFPSPGMYELFIDLYPREGTLQWLTKFVFTERGLARHSLPLISDLSPRLDGDVTVQLTVYPALPFAGKRTILYCTVRPPYLLELWLGTYAHAFWVSHDLLDSAHTHPIRPTSELYFDAYFPRPGTYRFWIQFQQKSKLHTVHFDIPVQG